MKGAKGLKGGECALCAPGTKGEKGGPGRNGLNGIPGMKQRSKWDLEFWDIKVKRATVIYDALAQSHRLMAQI